MMDMATILSIAMSWAMKMGKEISPNIAVTDEELKDRFRSDFSQDEYDGGRRTRKTKMTSSIPWKQVSVEIGWRLKRQGKVCPRQESCYRWC